MNDTRMTEEAAKTSDRMLFGFWVYLMSDCLLFAALFATYAVLRMNTNGGQGGATLFDLPFVLAETLILLTSSFTAGLMTLAANRSSKGGVLLSLGTTFLLGLGFLGLEMSEFVRLASTGASWQASGFLSAFFSLVGTHGAHILAGLLWMLVLATYILMRGLSATSLRKIAAFTLFWHFLDLIWIFIFTIVYLMGTL